MFQEVGLILCSEVGRLLRADFYYFIIADTSVTLAPAWCGKCRCSIMGLVYLVVRKWMMEMVFLLTTTLLFQYFSIITHPALWAPLFLEGNGLWCSKKLGNFGEQVCFRQLVLFYAPQLGDFGERGKNRGLLFLFSVGTLGLQIENNV